MLRLILVALTLSGAAPAAAQTMERRPPSESGLMPSRPGLFWEKCGACHGPAGPLVRERLSLTPAGTLATADGKDLHAFLRRHFGAPDQAEIEAIYGALLRLARGQGRFRIRCGICHESAESLARESLILRGDAVIGRYTGREIGSFLLGHGTEAASEAAFFEAILRRHLTAAP